MTSSSLKRLLHPKTVAVIGGKPAAEVIRQSKRIGFSGTIWAVNPKRQELEGYPCFPDVASLPAAPDASFIAVAREATIETVTALAKRGAGGAVCYASGFAEIGPEGLAAQQQLQNVMGDMAIVGPNCYGLLNYLDGVALWPDQHGGKKIEQGVAIIMQSGNIALNVTMQERSLPLAYLISVGNQAGVTVHDYIEAFLEDKRITAIGLHLEGLQDIQAFSKAAIKALKQNCPIVVLKTGTSEEGKQITLSHTSSLAGADKLYDALFERLGIIRVHTLPQFIETLKFLSTLGPLEPTGIASISCSGGEAALMADLAEKYELSFPHLTKVQRQGLFAVLGEKVELGNPLDYHTYIWGDEEAQSKCFAAMMQGKQAITLKILDYPKADCNRCDWEKTARAFCAAVKKQNTKGAIVSSLPETLPEDAREFLLQQGIAPMQGMEECLIAIKSAMFLYKKQKQRVKAVARASCKEGNIKTLNEFEGKQLMKKYGIPIPKSYICTTSNAPELATKLGFPVVLKILSETIIHKSDVGCVALNLRNKAEVKRAVKKMQPLGDRFLLEKMAAKPVVEMILGISRDPQFSLSLTLGAGGVLVELINDTQSLLFPIQKRDVLQAVSKLKMFPLLNGYRGQAAGDIEALVNAVMALATFAEEHYDSLVEVDINPLFVLPKGKGVVALDAIIRSCSNL
jgi:acetate---CoA ligase (ADP-forming)